MKRALAVTSKAFTRAVRKLVRRHIEVQDPVRAAAHTAAPRPATLPLTATVAYAEHTYDAIYRR